jgi:hypothetical protein
MEVAGAAAVEVAGAAAVEVAGAAAVEVAGAAAVEVAGAAAVEVAGAAADVAVVAPFLPPFLPLVAVVAVATLEAAVDAVPAAAVVAVPPPLAAALELATGTVCPSRIFYEFIVSGRTMDGRIKIKGVRTNLQDACVDSSRDNYAIAIHCLCDWTRCQPKDSLASQTWHWAKRGSETVGHESEEVVRDGRGRRCATLEKGLVLGDEDTGGSILLAIGRARGVRIISSQRLADAGTVQVHLGQRLGYLSIIVDDCEIIIPRTISMVMWKA